jgi:hypothetical protein
MYKRIAVLVLTALLGLSLTAEAQGVKKRTDAKEEPRPGDRSKSSNVQRSPTQQRGGAPSGTIRYREGRQRSAAQPQDRARSPGEPGRTYDRDPQRQYDRDRDGDRRYDGDRSDRRYPGPRSPDYRPPTGSIRHHYDRSPRHEPTYRGRRDIRTVRYPRYGTTLAHLPPTHRVIHHHNRAYYVHDGVFYAPVKSRYGVYRVVRPPIGVSVSFLPFGYTEVWFGGRSYYRYADVYYTEHVIGDTVEYVVVEPPMGAVIVDLPSRHRVVYYRSRPYYVAAGVVWEPFFEAGLTRYRRAEVDIDVDIDIDDDDDDYEIDVDIDVDD